MNKNEVIDLFKVISAAMPHTEIERPTIDIYAELLTDVPFEVARKNVVEHFRTNRFLPTPSEVRNGYTDAHERQKRETQAFIREQEQRKPIPVPAHIKERMDKLFGRERAE